MWPWVDIWHMEKDFWHGWLNEDLISPPQWKYKKNRLEFKQMHVCTLTGFTKRKPQTKTLWKLIGHVGVLSITQLGQLESFIYLFGRKWLESKIRINPCPILKNSCSWTFSINPSSGTPDSNFSSKTCIVKTVFVALTLNSSSWSFFYFISSPKTVLTDLFKVIFFYYVDVNKCYSLFDNI